MLSLSLVAQTSFTQLADTTEISSGQLFVKRPELSQTSL